MVSHALVAARGVSFAYDAASEPLFTHLSAHFPVGFTGIVGANGAGKTTLLRLMVGDLAPTAGWIEGVTAPAYCAQRTHHPPDTFEGFLSDWEAQAIELRGRLGIDVDFLERWHSLSHGERKRAQIAHALWRSPSVLAIDEPTNHIDAGARKLLLRSLKGFGGVGLIVSHDRELLDALCTQCLWLEPPRTEVFPGGFSEAREQKQLARLTAARERGKIVREHKRLKREVAKRREKAAGEHQARSKKGLSRKDSDGRAKIDAKRVSDGGAGGPLRQLDGRFARSEARLEGSRLEKQHETGIVFDGSRSQRDAILNLPPGRMKLGNGRSLRWPRMLIGPGERIAITGDNGTGKSTFVNHVLPLLNVPQEHVVILPQEISGAAARQILDDVRRRSGAQLGRIMNVVSRLNSRPERLLESRQPSPGELRKLLIAGGISASPHVIVMDEPTNHLDLPSIEALEQALADCSCALLLVSHDRRFVDGVGACTWTIVLDHRGDSVLMTDSA